MDKDKPDDETIMIELKYHLVVTGLLIAVLTWNVILWPGANQIGVFLIVVAQGLFFLGFSLLNDHFHRIFLRMSPGKLYVIDIVVIVWSAFAFLSFKADTVTCLSLDCPSVEEIAIEKLVSVIYFILMNSYFLGCLYQALKMIIKHDKGMTVSNTERKGKDTSNL